MSLPQVRGADLSDAGLRAWEQLRIAPDQARLDKLDWLHRTHDLLVASFGTLLVLVVVWMTIVLPESEAGPAREIQITPNRSWLRRRQCRRRWEDRSRLSPLFPPTAGTALGVSRNGRGADGTGRAAR